MTYSVNRYLTREEMTVNANYIYDYLSGKGWSKNAIAGMLGNMETESTINPGIWQSLDEGNMDMGFGLVQWTPASKYISWATDNGYLRNDINGQLDRLQYEIDNQLQWIPTSDYPLSFGDFKTSTETPEYLAQAFLRNYERPKDQTQPNRSTQARFWFDLLEGGGSLPAFPTTEGLEITSKYGFRIHPITGDASYHWAIDIGGQGVEHPIYATQSGVVIYNQSTSYGGWTIRLKHTGDNYYSQYQHLAVKSPLPIGTIVEKGERIGTMGTTGDSTGIHLDFAIAVREDGWFTETGTIDPEIYLRTPSGEGGDTPQPEPQPTKTLEKDIIVLLLTDALHGWK